jgi:predicted phosphate transport protein (TIGR00153 family)
MGVLDRFFATSPFIQLHEHAKKVHECVELIRPLTNALLVEDYDKIKELHNVMSKAEHEADEIKAELRDELAKLYFLSVGQHDLSRFLAYQDDIADAAEDYAVVLFLRKTKIPLELKNDFMAFVEQVISVSEQLINLESEISTLAEAGFTGKEAENVLEGIKKIGEEEWKSDRLGKKFARRFYNMEDKLDPITIVFLDKYCKRLSAISNNAERTAKYLRIIIRKK